MRCSMALLIGFALTIPAGCRNCDLVEAELRTRENELRELRAELLRVESHNEALQHELHELRPGLAAKVSPEQASQTYTLKEIVLGRQTGGYDNDGCPGDEALQIVLEPRDSDGHTIKAPGSLHVEAQEINPEGLKSPLSFWELSPEQLRRTWRNGFLSTGYFVMLPWKTWPSATKLRVTALFTLADDRAFEADKDVTIRLTPEDKRKKLVAPVGEPPAPEGESPLPLPRKVEPKQKPPKTALVEPATLWEPPAPARGSPPVHILQPIPVR